MTGDFRRTEVEPFQHQRNGIALGIQSGLYLAAQPILRLTATLQRGGREHDQKMRPRSNVRQYDALEISTGNTVVVKKNVVPMLSQILENGECPGNISAAVTDENRLLDALT